MSDRWRVIYEWDFETVADHGDVLDHSHWDKLKDAPFSPADLNDNFQLVLVRQTYREDYGVADRWYAYVEELTMPTHFDWNENGFKVPRRFLDEFRRWIKKGGVR
jgi:hypothetical protein